MFYEDLFEHDDTYARQVRLRELGYELPPTGDPLLDKWERQLARGEIPDLGEGEDEKSRIRDAWVREQAKIYREQTGGLLYRAPSPLEMMQQMGHNELQDLDYMSNGMSQQDPVLSSVMNSRNPVSPEAFDAFVSVAQSLLDHQQKS